MVAASLIDPVKGDSSLGPVTHGASHLGIISINIAMGNDVERRKISAEINLIFGVVVGCELLGINSGRTMSAHEIQQLLE